MNELIRRQKQRQMQTLLDGGLVMIHVDPRADGVSVPSQFANDPVLRLNIAYGFNLPALTVDAEGVYVVLSFNRRDFPCNLPWDSVFAMTAPDDGHEGIVWPDSVPPELAPILLAQAGLTKAPTPTPLRALGTRVSAEGAELDSARAPSHPVVSEEALAQAEAIAEELAVERVTGDISALVKRVMKEVDDTPPPALAKKGRPVFVVHEGGLSTSQGLTADADTAPDANTDADAGPGAADERPAPPAPRPRPSLTVVKS